jgi:hypothetical protein
MVAAMRGIPCSMSLTPPDGGAAAASSRPGDRLAKTPLPCACGRRAGHLDRQHLSLSLSLLRPRSIEKLGIRVEKDGMETGVLCFCFHLTQKGSPLLACQVYYSKWAAWPEHDMARPELGPSTIWPGLMQPDTIRPDDIFLSGCVGHRVALPPQARPYGQFFRSGRHGRANGPRLGADPPRHYQPRTAEANAIRPALSAATEGAEHGEVVMPITRVLNDGGRGQALTEARWW